MSEATSQISPWDLIARLGQPPDRWFPHDDPDVGLGLCLIYRYRGDTLGDLQKWEEKLAADIQAVGFSLKKVQSGGTFMGETPTADSRGWVSAAFLVATQEPNTADPIPPSVTGEVRNVIQDEE